MSVVSLSESQVKDLLNWPLVYEAVEQSLRSITETRTDNSQPTAVQPTRIFTPTPNGKGTLLTMPGFIGNYKLYKSGRGETVNSKTFNTLACKLVTAFGGNNQLNPPKPSIMGNIFIFDENTGELKAIVQATEITAWRTAGASLVATNHLFVQRHCSHESDAVGIVGCGVQGRIHAIGLCSLYSIDTIYLWNRTKKRAEDLATELNGLRQQFKNQNLNVVVCDSVAACVQNAGIIVTATNSSVPLVFRSMLKTNVHINAIGAGQTHNAELHTDIYRDPNTKIYVDSWGNARNELKSIEELITGEIGDIINGSKSLPPSGITIFHSLGMAVEDAAVAQAVLEKFNNNL